LSGARQALLAFYILLQVLLLVAPSVQAEGSALVCAVFDVYVDNTRIYTTTVCNFMSGDYSIYLSQSTVDYLVQLADEYNSGRVEGPTLLSVRVDGELSLVVEDVSVPGILQVEYVSGSNDVVYLVNVSAGGVSVRGNVSLYAYGVNVGCEGFGFNVNEVVVEWAYSGDCKGSLGGSAESVHITGLTGSWDVFLRDSGLVEILVSNLSNLVVADAVDVWVVASQVGGVQGQQEPGILEVNASGTVVFDGSSLFLERLAANGSTIRVSYSNVAVTGEAFIEGGELALVNSTLRLPITLVEGASNVVVEGCSVELGEPARVHLSPGAANATIVDSSLTCEGGCLVLVLHNTSLAVEISNSTFAGSSPAVSATAYHPEEGRASVVVEGSYFQDPAGPSVVVSGRTVRVGGLAIVLAGQVAGEVTIESWLAAPGGPLLEPAQETPFEYSVPGALQAIPALAGGGPSDYALIVKYPEVIEEPVVRLRNATIVAAYADGAPVEVISVAWGEYLVPRPAETLLLYLTPAPEPEMPQEASTSQPHEDAASEATPTTTTEAVPEGEDEGRGRLLAVLAVTAVGVVLAYAWVRGRPQGS